jgi:hypothetical protein
MSEKKIIYLVQGSRSNILKFTHLQNKSSDLITLTYDQDIDESEVTWLSNIFYPQSTFAEGRNKQLEVATQIGVNYLYYIFLDDDVSFKKGTYADFEKLLLKHEPAVGVPLCDIVKNSDHYIKKLKIQHPVVMDQIVQAYHHRVVKEKIVLPFVTNFDHLSWWYSCEINNYLILSYYRGFVMQFNTIEINNDNHNWNSETKEANVAHSTYLGGVKENELAQVKDYITLLHGKQPQLVNTLFHPNHMPRLAYMPDFRDSVYRLFLHLLAFELRKLLSTAKKILKAMPFAAYQTFFNKRNLIDPRNFQSYRNRYYLDFDKSK